MIMTQQEFDISFQEITKEMVEIAFEWVDFNEMPETVFTL